MKTRIKSMLPVIATRDEAEAAMNELALMVNHQRALITARDAKVLAVNKEFEACLAHHDQAIKLKTEVLRGWAETNPEQFPKGRKSLEMVSGVLGFRTGTPKLALLSRAWTWDKVLDRLCSIAKEFVRSKLEVDKDGILGAASKGEIVGEELIDWGLKITQEESFFIDPKLTEVETRQTLEAV